MNSFYRFGTKAKRAFLCFQICIILTFSILSLRAEEPSKKSPLWAIKTDKSTVFLMGSMHILKPSAFPLKQPLEEAFRVSETLVFETDLEVIGSLEFQMKILAEGMYHDGSTLEQHISKETFSAVKKRAESLGIPSDQINKLKPWACALTLVQFEFTRLGFDPNLGIDKHFFNRATSEQKKIGSLEPPDFQLQILTQLGKENEEAFLKQNFRDLDLLAINAEELYKSWRDGDTVGLSKLLDEGFKDFPELFNRIFVARNQDWLPKIEKYIAQGSKTLIVVGYGHLIGPKGLIQMLAAKGYAIEQR